MDTGFLPGCSGSRLKRSNQLTPHPTAFALPGARMVSPGQEWSPRGPRREPVPGRPGGKTRLHVDSGSDESHISTEFPSRRPKYFASSRVIVISSKADLEALAERIRKAPWVGLDTEADSLHAYPEKLCLVQIAIPGEELLVDPLADLHLEPLWEALDHHEILLHAADYDLRLLFQGHHFRPANIFDTMWAARLLGESRFGLNDLLTKYLGITLEKGSQKANWGRRPLTERMTDYALNDVRYLKELRDRLEEGLVGLGRLEWLNQICRRNIEDAAVAERRDQDQVWRTKGHDKLSPLGLAVLREIWHWREKDALRTGRPPFFVLRHEQLFQIAEAAAESQSHRGLPLPAYLTPRRREGLVEAAKRGLAVPESERPIHHRVRTRRLTRAELNEAEIIRLRRDAQAKLLNIDPTLIAAKATLFALARHDEFEWERLLPWQRELLKPAV